MDVRGAVSAFRAGVCTTASVEECDTMADKSSLDELDRRRARATQMGGAEKLAKRRSRGQLNAEESLALLVDPGSFQEVGLLGASSVYRDDEVRTPRDGKIAGFAKIDGRDVGVVVNDF